MRLPDRPGLTDYDIIAAEVRTRDRDRYLSVLYAPAELRAALMALHGLDLELAQVVAGTTEPMIGEIRLAWWREALLGLDAGKVPAQPLLRLLADEVLPRGINGAELAGLEDRWLAMLGHQSADAPPAFIEGGVLLFGLAARLLGGDQDAGGRLGGVWAIGELARVMPHDASLPSVHFPVRPAFPLRPLLGLARLAWHDLWRYRGRERPPTPRGSAGRQLRLLWAIAFGR